MNTRTKINAGATKNIGAALLLLGLIPATRSWAAPTSCSAAIQNCISAANGKTPVATDPVLIACKAGLLWAQ